MIYDQFENYRLYPYGVAWEKAFTFLQELTPDAEEKEYPIQGNEIFARVMSYDTRSPEEAKLEAHRRYMDIQVTLCGVEAMEYFPVPQLEIKAPYSDEKDVVFFQLPAMKSPARLIVSPGFFAVFFPGDAHMPQLMASDSVEHIKKVVVKVQCDLLGLPR